MARYLHPPGSLCSDEDCPSHGEHVRAINDLEKEVKRKRDDLIWVMLLWSSSAKARAFQLGSDHCETCGWLLDSAGRCAWCDDSTDMTGAV